MFVILFSHFSFNRKTWFIINNYKKRMLQHEWFTQYTLITAYFLLVTLLWFNRHGIVSTDKIMDEISEISEALEVGTRIHWDASTQSAIFVDVPTSMVYKYDAASGNVTSAKVGDEPLAFMFPTQGSNTQYIAGLDRKFVLVEWDGVSPNVSSVKTIGEVDTAERLKGNRLNGGKVDPEGRLWAGTMGPSGAGGLTEPGRGALYSVEKGVIKKHVCSIGLSNGLAWDNSAKKMYYIDTLIPGVLQFDYDPPTSQISNRIQIFDFKKNGIEGLPDGLTIDSNGNLWVCAIFGSEIVNFNPKDGSVIKRIKFPTPEITAVSFGGPNLDALYVTSAKMPINGTVPPDPAGKTFVVTNFGGAKGLAGDRYIP